MIEVLPNEKIQPCLLDRLTDKNPASQVESRTDRVMRPAEYREAVLRDLRWLLNCTAHPAGDFEGYEEVTRSVLNFGIVDLCGRIASGLSMPELEARIAEALRLFEPRIDPDSLQIKALVNEETGRPNTIALEIRGELWASPQPEHLQIKTEIDLDTGQCKV